MGLERAGLEGHARRLWTVAEPIHAVTYFADESFAAYEAAGLHGFWRGYFAGRAAPMGAVAAGPVIAAFYNFAPDFVRRAVPDVWNRTSPGGAIEARQRGAVAALRGCAGGAVTTDVVAQVVVLLRAVAERSSPFGRGLFAANLELSWPDEPLAALWHGTTLLREHRGDGHVAGLVGAELDGCEAHLLRLAIAGLDGTWVRAFRGWDDAARDDAWHRLLRRGLIDGSTGVATEAGRQLMARVESATDRLAARPLEAVGEDVVAELLQLLTPIATAVAAEVIPFPNPIGVPAP